MQRTFARTRDSLEQVFEFVSEFLEPIGAQRLNHKEIHLVVEELFTNFVRHNKQGHNEIGIELQRYPERIEIVVIDTDVEPFDVTKVPALDVKTPLEKRRGGGMGLHLVRTIADKFSYDYRNRTSRITVEKQLESSNV